jgi:hypothetical protein
LAACSTPTLPASTITSAREALPEIFWISANVGRANAIVATTSTATWVRDRAQGTVFGMTSLFSCQRLASACCHAGQARFLKALTRNSIISRTP